MDPIRAARLTPSALANYVTRGTYSRPPHVRHMERVALEVAAGRKKRVIISMPPRHGKSEFWSKYFVAWFLGIFQRRRVILASYEADFAASWGRAVRDILFEHGRDCFGLTVRGDSNAANRWEIRGQGGGMQTAGAGGPILGKGADCIADGSLIQTPYGTMPIESIAADGSMSVLSWDHSAGRAEWRVVRATRRIHAANLVRVTTSLGRCLVCTGDHRVHVGLGIYRAARDLVPGDCLTVAETSVPLVGCDEQRDGEFGLPLSDVSPASPQEHEDTVSMVELVRGGGMVNDLQVEGNANFFASGILVHNCAIIDDPIKNFEEAYSETHQEKLWNWYTSTLRSRLEPGGAVVIIQQRWHDEDLVGRLLRQEESLRGRPEREAWESIIFPAVAEEGDVLGREPGEALWPERFTSQDLAVTRAVIPSFVWSAQYQQRPTPFGGNMFKREFARYYSDADLRGANMPDRFVTVDTACSEDQTSDFTSIAAWGITRGGRLTLLDLDLRRLEAPAISEAIKAMLARHDCVAWIESTAQSKHLIQFLRAEGVSLRELEPGAKSKVVRAMPAAAMWEAGKVVLPRDAPWLAEAERQLYAFPGGKHDDFVDSLAWAAYVMRFVQGGGPPRLEGTFRERDYLPSGIAINMKRPSGMLGT